MPGFFSPDGANAVVSRPSAKEPSLSEGWCQDVTSPGAGNGTVITASLLNQIIANLRDVVTELGGDADGDDDMLRTALLASLMQKITYDPNTVAADAFDMANMVEAGDAKVMSAAERVKLAYLTVTGAIDLDAIDSRINALGSSVVLQGGWDASAGTFPGTSNTLSGDSYIVTTGGTVDGVVFTSNDRLLAITDDASPSTYAGNWLILDYSDAVSSVEGQTGALTLSGLGAAPLASPALTGAPTAPTQSADDNTTKIATTAYVQGELTDKAPLASPALTGDPTAPTQSAADNTTKLATTAFVQGEISSLGVTVQGNCQLAFVSTTQIKLSRHNGKNLFIEDTNVDLPSGGVTLANTGLTAATLYYIYAWNNTGTVTLEASTTAYAIDSTYGHKIKSGNSTRTLVGMVYMGAGTPGTFMDDVRHRFTRSWFNRKRLVAYSAPTDILSSSTSYFEIDSTDARLEFINWADERITFHASGNFNNNTAAGVYAAAGIGGTQVGGYNVQSSATGRPGSYAVCYADAALSEGYHYANAMGRSASGACNYNGNFQVLTGS